ncbi:DUF6517 family protein [Halegenticoccus soli]|uniref:DUF6517 family protein n=1 Tax=Halegenticoccus soli TaxID=1985678 RepID=UPI000C6CF67D|nr:DUF6517 family protein [Halegenticoccus soli]
MPSPPAVPGDRLAGWRPIEESTETPFSTGFFAVTAHAAVYEDADLRASIRERTGADRTWRIFLAGRLVLTPPIPVTAALERLVASRTAEGFARQLRDRGFSSVRRTGARSFPVDGVEARLTAYDAVCETGDATLAVEAQVAVWRDGGEFLFAGGAHPTAVREADDATAAALGELLRPEAFRDELFGLIRATGTAGR